MHMEVRKEEGCEMAGGDREHDAGNQSPHKHSAVFVYYFFLLPVRDGLAPRQKQFSIRFPLCLRLGDVEEARLVVLIGARARLEGRGREDALLLA